MDAEKAIRVLAASRPVYVDAELLLLRSAVLDETVFVWTRRGAADPPEVDVAQFTGAEAADALPGSVARALAAKERSKAPRPARNDGGIPRYN